VDAVSEQNAAIYQAHAGMLVRFATGLVGPSDANDVVANSVLRAMTSKSWPQAGASARTNPRFGLRCSRRSVN
jgi:DNA-directed RNA polymerase specialized sigma24 family protein